MSLLSKLGEDDDDPIMKLNPTLYKVVQADIDNNFFDPF